MTSSPPDTSHNSRYILGMALGALGVVYGDIGTSPLYALRECFGEHIGLVPNRGNVLGVLSLITWSLIIVVTIKYMMFVMRADNRGEGGILALMALSSPRKDAPSPNKFLLITLGLFGAALLYGEGSITPAITVLSAIEGLGLATPLFKPYVIPITLVILVGIFLIQRQGTARVGAVFGPVICAWFIVIALLGIRGITLNSDVIVAVNPIYAFEFLTVNPRMGFLTLGSVFLVVTGGESLYADMGHFGLKPIRLAWFALVLPSLMLNYFGQGALILHQPESLVNPFYSLAPSWALYPLVGMATMASIIASQAVISGAFSLTRQAVQLGYLPRVQIIHTSEREIGQIYVPVVNWALMVGVIVMVLGFQHSSAVAAAYGIAVTTTMVITTILAYFVARRVWKWSFGSATALASFFLVIDVGFLSANLTKIPHGGWVPLVVAGAVFTMMATWKRGRDLLSSRLTALSLPIDLFLADVARHPERRVKGTAVFMTGSSDGTPPGLLHNLKHNKIIHERVVLLTVMTEEVPFVPPEDRVGVVELGHGFFRVFLHYGFTQTPQVPEDLHALHHPGLEFDMMDTSFYLSRETLFATRNPGMSLWRESLFIWLSRNALSATAFFDLPPNRVVELGAHIEL